MSVRKFVMLAVVVALTFTPVLAVEAGEGKGKIVKLDSAANVLVLEDGTMYRMVHKNDLLPFDSPELSDKRTAQAALPPIVLSYVRECSVLGGRLRLT